MDPLTHVFLPLTVVYVLRPEFFRFPHRFLLGALGLFSDFDKFLGVPGSLHSLIVLTLLILVMGGVERLLRSRLVVTPIAATFLLSHPLLDVLDGGPVPILFPITTDGIGLRYPARIVFGTGVVGFTIEGPLVSLHGASPRPGYNSYGFINGFGVASTLLFFVIYSQYDDSC